MKISAKTSKANRSGIYLLNNPSIDSTRRESEALTAGAKKKLPPSHFSQTALLTQRKAETTVGNGYDVNFLSLLDDLQCPLLLLPPTENERVIERIGFFTDLRFTGIPAISLVVKLAKSLNAQVTILNIAEDHMPEMDLAYAKRCFDDLRLSLFNGTRISLANLKKTKCPEAIEAALDQNGVQMTTALQKRKDLLYTLASTVSASERHLQAV